MKEGKKRKWGGGGESWLGIEEATREERGEIGIIRANMGGRWEEEEKEKKGERAEFV